MAVTYEAISGFLTLRLEGEHSLAQEREALARALVSPELEVRAALLVDARRSTTNPPGASIAERARCLGQLLECLLPRCAVLVSGSLHYGLARMFAVHAERYGVTVGVFTDERDARSFLACDDSRGHPAADPEPGPNSNAKAGAVCDGPSAHSKAPDASGT